MEAVAKKFEKEDGILEEIRRQANTGDDLYSYQLSVKFHCVPEDGYFPYCDISFDFNAETPAITWECSQEFSKSTNKYGIGNFRPEYSEASISCAASTLCSFGEPVESFSASDNVWFLSYSYFRQMLKNKLFLTLWLMDFISIFGG